MRMKVIYHSADFDGIGSGALLKRHFSDALLIGYDYNEPFPWDKLKPGETVYMVDVSASYETMERLNKNYNFFWIDHHYTAINTMAPLHLKGLQRSGTAAVILVWEYLYGTDDPIPEIILHLGAHDVWDHSHPDTLPIQYGLRVHSHSPDNIPFWDTLIRNFGGIVEQIADDGRKIQTYVDFDYAEYAKTAAFELRLPNGLRALACNRGLTGSLLVQSLIDPLRHDCAMIFYWRKNGWKFSLYSDKKTVDLGAFAKQFPGGGGHKQAAGFELSELPFHYDPDRKEAVWHASLGTESTQKPT